MPTLNQAQQLKEFAEEILELSKEVWAAQSRSRGRDGAELTETEFLTLDLLAKHQPLTVGDIQRSIGVLPAQMSRVIRSLEAKGDEPLITCRINAQDKRKVDVELSAAGQKAYQAYRKSKLGSLELMLQSLSDHDREEFMRILRLIRQHGREVSQTIEDK